LPCQCNHLPQDATNRSRPLASIPASPDENEVALLYSL
jgi:hypothetical protein